MSDLYLKSMRGASKLLFWIAVILVVGSILVRLLMQFDDQGTVVSANRVAMIDLISTVIGALSAAVWPLFGAALLWRWDRWQTAKEISE